MQVFKVSAIAFFFLYNYVDCDGPPIGVVEEFREPEYVLTEEETEIFSFDSNDSDTEEFIIEEPVFNTKKGLPKPVAKKGGHANKPQPGHIKVPHAKAAHTKVSSPKPVHTKAPHIKAPKTKTIHVKVPKPPHEHVSKPHPKKIKETVKKAPTVIVKEHVCPKGSVPKDKKCFKTVVFKAHAYCPAPSKPIGHKCLVKELPEVTCPRGFSFKKKQCVKITKSPVELVCTGPGEVLNKRDECCEKIVKKPPQCPLHAVFAPDKTCCLLIVPAKTKCEEGFKLKHGSKKCIKEKDIIGERECPQGSKFDETTQKCLLPETKPLTKCPIGFQLDNEGSCVKEVAKISGACLLPFLKNDKGVCEEQIFHSPILQCEADFTLNGGRCTRGGLREDTCPPGFRFSRASPNVCEKIVNERIICPTTTQLTDARSSNTDAFRCRRPVTKDLIRCCPTNFELVGGKNCTRLITRAPQLTCDKECFRLSQTPASFYCPEDTEFVHNSTLGFLKPVCVRTVELNICVRRVDELGNCTSTTTTTALTTTEFPISTTGPPIWPTTENPGWPTTEAPVSSTTEAPVSSTTEAPVSSTTEEPVLSSTEQLLTLNTAEIGQAGTEVSAKAGSILRNGMEVLPDEGNMFVRRFEMGRQLQATGGSGTSVECGNSPNCRNVTRVEIFDATPFCPQGGTLNGNICITEIPIIPETICVVGQYNQTTGFCDIYEHAPTIDKCPEGFEPSGAVCIGYEHEKPHRICPEGSSYNENGYCVIIAAAISGESFTESRLAIATCASGQYLNGDQTACVETIVRVVPQTCPSNAEETLEGNCLIRALPIKLTPNKKYVLPIYVCPGGNDADITGHCKSVKTSRIIFYCDKGFELDEEEHVCIKHVDIIKGGEHKVTTSPILVCPDKAKPHKGVCINHKVAPPIIKCPRNFTMTKGKCIKTIPVEYLCPDGTHSDHKQCFKQIKVPAQVKIVKGCSYTPNKKCKTCAPSYKGLCQSK